MTETAVIPYIKYYFLIYFAYGRRLCRLIWDKTCFQLNFRTVSILLLVLLLIYVKIILFQYRLLQSTLKGLVPFLSNWQLAVAKKPVSLVQGKLEAFIFSSDYEFSTYYYVVAFIPEKPFMAVFSLKTQRYKGLISFSLKRKYGLVLYSYLNDTFFFFF